VAVTAEPSLRLAALIPAHDEEATIERSVRSLVTADYPREAWRVVVVADNCADGTADVAGAAGAEVLVRNNAERRGKGQALAHGMRELLASEDPPDAIVVIDADCEATPNLPRVVAREMGGGARAVQLGNVVSNPNASTYSALRFAAFAAINSTRPRGRVRLGLSAGLLGTGMAFSRELLAERPWEAYGLAEDGEYHLSLVEGGERVAFADDAGVSSPMPTSFESAGSQQARWEAGRWALLRRWLPRLARAGARRRDPSRAAAAADPATPPLSLLVAATGALAAASAAAGARLATRLSLFALAGQAVYVTGSLAIARAPASVYRALAAAPLLMLWELRIVARTVLRRGPRAWVRTARESNNPRTGRYTPYTAVGKDRTK
jgi:1,2-diacylglycerol 3-beta-glucosyltransferase